MNKNTEEFEIMHEVNQEAPKLSKCPCISFTDNESLLNDDRPQFENVQIT